MLIESVVICLIILLISYRRHRFDFMQFKWLPLLYIGFGVEIVAAQLIVSRQKQLINSLTPYLQVFIYVCLLAFVLTNTKRYRTISLVGLGFLLNAIVILANGGRMPVDTTMALKYGFTESLKLLNNDLVFGHQALTSATKLPHLADVISVAPPYPRPQTLSIGDIIIDFGLILLTIELIITVRKVKKYVA